MVRSSYVRKLRFNDVGFWLVIVRYFVLLNNYVTLGLQKQVFLIKSDIRHFFCTFRWRTKSTSQLRCVLVCQLIVSFPTSELCCECFSYNDIFFMALGLRSFVVHCFTYINNVWNNVWKLQLVCVPSLWCISYDITVTLFICSM